MSWIDDLIQGGVDLIEGDWEGAAQHVLDAVGSNGAPSTVPVVPSNGGTPPIIPNGGGNGVANVTGLRVSLPLGSRSVAACPPGYVAVDTNKDGHADMCMLKSVARDCRLWKARPKPVLTASDRKALNRAQRVIGKVDTVVKQTNEIQGKARYSRSRPTRK